MSTTDTTPLQLDDLRIRRQRALGRYVVVSQHALYCGITSGEIGRETLYLAAHPTAASAWQAIANFKLDMDPDDHRFELLMPFDRFERERERALAEAEALTRGLFRLIDAFRYWSDMPLVCDHAAGICCCGERDWLNEASAIVVNVGAWNFPVVGSYHLLPGYANRHWITSALLGMEGAPWLRLRDGGGDLMVMHLHLPMPGYGLGDEDDPSLVHVEHRMVSRHEVRLVPGKSGVERTISDSGRLAIDAALAELYHYATGKDFDTVAHFTSLVEQGIAILTELGAASDAAVTAGREAIAFTREA